ncbi:hypothetical protein ACFL2O_08575 [Thermodesulfobacteriota bacterium]
MLSKKILCAITIFLACAIVIQMSYAELCFGRSASKSEPRLTNDERKVIFYGKQLIKLEKEYEGWGQMIEKAKTAS